MKPTSKKRPLVLARHTLRPLDSGELAHVVGGVVPPGPGSSRKTNQCDTGGPQRPRAPDVVV
jgi:hypothetical protein